MMVIPLAVEARVESRPDFPKKMHLKISSPNNLTLFCNSEKNCRNNENHAENLENIDMRNKLNVSASNGDSDNNLGLRTPVRFRGDGIRK